VIVLGLCLVCPTAAHSQVIDLKAQTKADEKIKTVSVLEVEVIGNVDPDLAITYQEALKSEVRQNDKLNINLNGNDIPISEFQILNDCEKLDLACLRQGTEFLETESIAFASIEPAPGGFKITMRWFVNKENLPNEKGLIYENEVAVLVPGNVTDAENASPRLAFKLFGGETGDLEIKSNEIGAAVYLIGNEYGEGRQVGVTPFQRAIIAGKYKVRVTKETYEDFEQDIEILSGRATKLEVRLEPLIKGLPPTSKILVISGWAVTATGVAFLIAGGATGFVTASREDELQEILSRNGGQPSVEDVAEARDVKADGEEFAKTTNVLLGIGGALTFIGAGLLTVGYMRWAEPQEEELIDADGAVSDFDIDFMVTPTGGAAFFKFRF